MYKNVRLLVVATGAKEFYDHVLMYLRLISVAVEIGTVYG